MKKLFALLLLAALPPLVFAQEQATSLGGFDDSIGVNTHLSYTNSVYANFPEVLQAIQILGVKHIRDGYYPWPAGNAYYAQFQQLKAAGIGIDFVVPYTTPVPVSTDLDAFCQMAGGCEALEYPNELDSAANTPAVGIPAALIAMSAPLLAATTTLKIPLIGPSFTQAATYAAVGNIGSTFTANNLHIYFGGRNPETIGWGSVDSKNNAYGSVAWWLDNAAVDGPSNPSWVTETGYLAPGCAPPVKTTGHPCAVYPDPLYVPYALNAASDGTYTLRTLFELWNAGIKRSYLYELFDEPSSPSYGLVQSIGWTKRGFLDLSSLMYLLSDGVNPNEASENAKLTYTLSGSTANVQHTLLERRDGCFFLVLWLGVPDVDVTTGNPLTVAPQAVTLTLPSTTVQIEYFFQKSVQYSQAVPAAQTGPTKTYTLQLSDYPTILRIR